MSEFHLRVLLYWHDMMMLKEDVKEIMGEDTCEAGDAKITSIKEMKGH